MSTFSDSHGVTSGATLFTDAHDTSSTANATTDPGNFIFFGPHANCTLELCSIKDSVFQYRPSIAANAIFIALFSVGILVHGYLGWRWKSWWFAIPVMIGCCTEIVGYIGRIMLYDNPWSFNGFLIQIILITTAPVYFTASIYVTLSRTINYLNPSLARMPPSLYYWVFIPADVLCLCLQGTGGALSTVSSGSSSTGIDIAMAGLILQVIILFFFSAFFLDYIFRYTRDRSTPALETKVKVYLSFLFLSIFLIFVRCIYRSYELSEGYNNSKLITNQGLFIGLEGVLIALAVFTMCIGNPGMIFHNSTPRYTSTTSPTGRYNSDGELTVEKRNDQRYEPYSSSYN